MTIVGRRFKQENLTEFEELLEEDKKEALWQAAHKIIKKLNIKTIIETEPRPMIYWWNNGKYVPKADGKIRQEAKKLGGKFISVHDITEIIGHIKGETYVSEDDFDTDIEWLSTESGMLNIMTNKIKDHSPDNLTRVQLPINYEADAPMERWDLFLKEVVCGNPNEPTIQDQKKIDTMQEMVGYCLYRENPFHKAVMLTGEGNNGKSVFLDTIINLLGKENVSTVPIQAFDSREYALNSMVDKMANINSDLNKRGLKESGNFKQVVAGDRVYVNRKYQEPINKKIFAKLMFSANQVPASDDQTHAFYRRWLIINFPNKFEGKNDDPHLKEKLKEELPGILNWAVVGLKRLLENKAFSYNLSAEETEMLYLTLSSPVDAFVAEKLEQDSDAIIPKTLMYSHFIEYAKSKRMPSMMDNAFARKLKEAANPIDDGKRKVGDEKQVPCWIGWKLKTPEKTSKDVKIDKNGQNIDEISGLSGLFSSCSQESSLIVGNIGQITRQSQQTHLQKEVEEKYPDGLPEDPRARADKSKRGDSE